MAKKLGKLEKPEADKFSHARRLFFVPLVFTPPQVDKELSELFCKYWQQAGEQVANLESKMAAVKKIYHELVTPAAGEGDKAIEKLNAGNYPMVKAYMERGSELLPIEDEEMLMEFMDWSRCLSFGLQSQKAVSQVYQSFQEVQKKRNEHIAKSIDETLKDSEIGILFMREGHQVQFPPDIQVFYVAPPSLDEINHWQPKPPKSEEQPKPKKEKAPEGTKRKPAGKAKNKKTKKDK